MPYESPKGACGRWFCPAVVRLIWASPDVPAKHAAHVWAGCSQTELRRRADLLSLPSSRSGRRYVRVSKKRLEAAWLDLSVSLNAAAASVGLHPRVFFKRAKDIGLPKRPSGAKPTPLPENFAEMWDAGVCSHALASAFGLTRSAVTHRARRLGLPSRKPGIVGISIAAFRAGVSRADVHPKWPSLFRSMWLAGVATSELARLSGRSSSAVVKHAAASGLSPRPKSMKRIKLAEFEEMNVIRAFEASARETRAAMRDAEMIDRLFVRKAG